MSRVLLILCVSLSLSSGCKEQEPLPEPAPTPKSVLMVADKSVETPVRLAIGTKGESSLRVVLSSAPLTCAKLRKSYPERPASGKAFVLDFWLVRPLEADGKLGDWTFRSAYLEDGEDGRGLAARAALLDGVREGNGKVSIQGLDMALGDGPREILWDGQLDAEDCGRVAREEADRPQPTLTWSIADQPIEVHGASLRPDGPRYLLRFSRAPHNCNTVFTEGYDVYLDLALDGDPPKVVLASLNGDQFPSTPSRSGGLDALRIELDPKSEGLDGSGHFKAKIDGDVDLRGYKMKLHGAFEALRCTLRGESAGPSPSSSAGR